MQVPITHTFQKHIKQRVIVNRFLKQGKELVMLQMGGTALIQTGGYRRLKSVVDVLATKLPNEPRLCLLLFELEKRKRCFLNIQ